MGEVHYLFAYVNNKSSYSRILGMYSTSAKASLGAQIGAPGRLKIDTPAVCLCVCVCVCVCVCLCVCMRDMVYIKF